MSRAVLCLATVVLASCGGGESAVDEAAITNRAAAIVESANATVAAQIAEIDQKAAEDFADQLTPAPGSPLNASTATPNKQ